MTTPNTSDTSTAVVPAGSPKLGISLEVLQRIDTFANENSIALLTEDKGAFTAAINMAAAIDELRNMLTPEVMAPIMKLQGLALGFKTDKDKERGYGVDVVRDCFIEATLKGFKMVGNQSNIIAGRFYATKEGFEDYFLRQAKKGAFLDFRDAYSVPRTVGAEALVVCSATWKWNGVPDKIENLEISIRVNAGQGSDAILGKAKRKLLAKIYARVTGTVISEGDANEAAIDVTTVPTQQAPKAEEMADEATLKKLDDALNGHLPKAHAWLVEQGWIQKDQTHHNVNAARVKRILDNVPGFLKTVGAIK